MKIDFLFFTGKAKALPYILVFASQLYSAPIDLQPGVRPLAMGGAVSALANDTAACAFNPGGLGTQERFEAEFIYGLYQDFQAVTNSYFALANKIGAGGVGFAWQNISAELLEGDPDLLLEKKNYLNENTMILGYGMNVTDRTNIGITLKRLSIDSSIGGGAGLGFDIGFLNYFDRKKRFSYAGVLKNVSSDMKNEAYGIDYRFGLGARILRKKNLKIGFDIDTKNDINNIDGRSYRLHAGVELLLPVVTLRAGYDNGTITGGLGLTYKSVTLAFSYIMNKNIGDIIRAGIGFSPAQKKRTQPGAASGSEEEKIARKKELYDGGVKAFKKKKYEKALKYAGELLKIDPEDEQAQELRKQCEEGLEEEKMKEVRKLFTEGKKIYGQKKYAKAAKYFKKVLEILPGHEDSKTMLRTIDEILSSQKKK